jgi:peptidoglycan/xylan/chitin deacetylase (PgdA/CDA1 family)
VSSDADSHADSFSRLIGPRVLAFHKLSPKFSFGSTNFSPARFEALLRSLAASQWDFVSALPGKTHPDNRAVAITFDDGYAHLAEVLPRLIEILAIEPLIFMPTSFIGKPNSWDYTHYFVKEPHLDRPAIRMLAERGVRFGSHSHGHVDLAGLSDRKLIMELRQSKELLQDAIRQEITTISYPFGRANERVISAAYECGYRAGFTMRFPTPSDHPLLQGRIPIYGFDTQLSISRKLAGEGVGYQIERLKCGVTNSLSGGTVLLNRLRRVS